jgi:TolB protein
MLSKKRTKNLFRKKKKRRLSPLYLLLGILALAFFLVPQTRPSNIPIPASPTPSTIPTPAPPTPRPPTLAPTPLPTGVHGGRLIFTCTRGDFNHLCMVNRDGSGLLQITSGNANDYYPSFSPDGGAIVFASTRSLGTFDLYMMILQTSQIMPLTDEIGNVFSPEFSPDGEEILFINRKPDSPTELWVIRRDGSNPRLIFGGPNYRGPNTIVSASWSPDGSKIAMAMSVQNPFEYQIFVMDSEGKTDPQRITYGMMGITGSVDWSPDGKAILISAGPVEDKDIFRYEIESGLITRLTFGGNNNAPVYSPDGEWIAFNSLRNGGQADIYLMRADGSELTRLTDNPEPDWQPQWEP